MPWQYLSSVLPTENTLNNPSMISLLRVRENFSNSNLVIYFTEKIPYEQNLSLPPLLYTYTVSAWLGSLRGDELL